MSIPNIRLAFQGGGAKLIAMLPIAHAFSEAHRDGDIEIKQVSGTSAGAICAALVSARADFSKVRDHIVQVGPGHLAALVPPRIAKLVTKARQQNRVGMFNILLNLDIVKAVALAGKPILNWPELERFIQGLFNLQETRHITMIEHCPISLAITTSDIVQSAGVTHRSGDLVRAVADSCSLPILLRSFESLAQTHHVDGGLCDNLPVETLLGDHQDTIFAVYPKNREIRLTLMNIISYLSSLLAASIGHSVKRSVAMVSPPFRFEADTDLSLTDFEAAVERLSDTNWYNAQKEEAARRIRDFSVTYGFAMSPNQARVIDVLNIGQYQKTLSNLVGRSPSSMRCLSVKFIVRVNSDEVYRSEKDALRRRADTLTRVIRFEIGDDVPTYYCSHVNIVEENIVPTIWSARNITRDIEIPIRALPLERSADADFQARECLLEFVDALDNLGPGDTLEIQSTYHSVHGRDMRALNFGSPDSIEFDNGRDETIPVAQLILVCPTRLGRARLMFDDGASLKIAQPPTKMTFDDDDRAFAGVANGIVGLCVANLQPGAKLSATAIVTSNR